MFGRTRTGPSVARRLAAGSSRRLSTHRQDRRSRSYSASREKRCRVSRPSWSNHESAEIEGQRFMERDDSRAERIQYPSRSGLGSVARNCRRESPPGSEAVRRGESPSKPVAPISITGASELPGWSLEPARNRAQVDAEFTQTRGMGSDAVAPRDSGERAKARGKSPLSRASSGEALALQRLRAEESAGASD
jgi:hypothetical protein